MIPSSLFGPGDPGPVEEWSPRARAFPALLVCDHASSRVPGPLCDLGLTEGDLARPADEIIAASGGRPASDDRAWPSLLRMLDCEDPSYRE